MSSRPLSYYRTLPKIDLHRHLEGSLRLTTLNEIAQKERLDLPLDDLSRLGEMVQIQPSDPPTHLNFLSKFKALRHFFCSPEIIRRMTREAVEDAAADNVRYLELRFTPVALSRIGKYPLGEVMDWVLESAHEACAATGLITRLIVSVNRHESPQLAADVARLALDRRERGVVGLDLAGDEANFPALPFVGIFQEAREAGLAITLHAGEWAGADNVIEAIDVLGAVRIGHGVRVMEDPDAVALAREHRTVFEVCPTSNHQSGVVAALKDHPLPGMLAAGLDVTIHTDDPAISQITLSDEYALACDLFGLSLDTLRKCVLSAAQAAFLPTALREQLTADLAGAFQNP
jgi:adenosine deaminase